MGRKAQATQASHEIVSSSAEETQAFGEQLGRLLRPGDVVALRGELGSGKTTLIQGLARGLGLDPDAVKSPTFVLMREYPGAVPLIHIDGYRLQGAPSIAWLDLDLLFSPQKVTVIEWAERFEGLLPEDAVALSLAHVSANRRRISVAGTGTRSQELTTHLHAARSTQHAERATQESHDSSSD